MKMWKAMLRGSKKGPQVRMSYFSAVSDGGSCALGAAFLGCMPSVDFIIGYKLSDFFTRYFPHISLYAQHALPCNCAFSESHNIAGSIIHLNDSHDWTREAIAEWVKTIEDKITREKWEARKAQRAANALIAQPVERLTCNELIGVQVVVGA